MLHSRVINFPRRNEANRFRLTGKRSDQVSYSGWYLFGFPTVEQTIDNLVTPRNIGVTRYLTILLQVTLRHVRSYVDSSFVVASTTFSKESVAWAIRIRLVIKTLLRVDRKT
jgi:hypothetical protein